MREICQKKEYWWAVSGEEQDSVCLAGIVSAAVFLAAVCAFPDFRAGSGDVVYAGGV